MFWMGWITVKRMEVDKTNSVILCTSIYMMDNDLWEQATQCPVFVVLKICKNGEKSAINFCK